MINKTALGPVTARTLFLTFVAAALAIFSAEAYAQGNSSPRFEDYRVQEKFKGWPAPVNLQSHPKARLVRSQLIAEAKRGPNFADHYTVVLIGCGTACQMVGIVDAISGKVYFLPDGVEDVSYRRNSNLLIVDPLTDPPSPTLAETKYYKWQRGQLVLIEAR
jgi:hypothetical protein